MDGKKKNENFNQPARKEQDPASETEGYTPEIYSDITADEETEKVEKDMENRPQRGTDESL